MLAIIDRRLNNVTMYRLLAYGLVLLLAVSLLFASLDLIQLDYLSLVASISVLVVSCLTSNWLFAKIYQVPANSESAFLTALILALILNPTLKTEGIVGLVVAGVIAMASKYLLVLNRKHLFNPAAIAAVAIVLLGLGRSTWWVGSANLLPFTLVFGFLIARKIRREDMVLCFVVTAVAMITVMGVLVDGRGLGEMLAEAFLSWPVIFLATVMLTEPITTPPGHLERNTYAVLAAVLMTSRWDLRFIAASPALALVLANIFSYVVGSKQRVILTLKEVVKMAPNVWDFVFTPSEKLKFTAGQYAEWTLPLRHGKKDERGNRRYFTIASAPTEDVVRLGAKFYPEPSAFKEELQGLQVGDEVVLGQVTGDFILPEKQGKLLFLAGGIGITPFRSMLGEMEAAGSYQDIVLIYAAASFTEVAYRENLEAAKLAGVKVVLLLGTEEGVPSGWEVRKGFLTPELLRELVPDAHLRRAYISGPNIFVDSAKKSCRNVGVAQGRIVTDYFPGY